MSQKGKITVQGKDRMGTKKKEGWTGQHEVWGGWRQLEPGEER